MFFKSKKISVFAPCKGTVIPLSRVPDDVFSQKILGDGCAVDPKESEICAPVAGEVTMVSDTSHAYAILTKDNIEILVHVGIDTVKLKGEGFTPLVKKGQKVGAGDPLVRVDLDQMITQGFCTFTMIVVSPNHQVDRIEIKGQSVEKTTDELFVIYRK